MKENLLLVAVVLGVFYYFLFGVPLDADGATKVAAAHGFTEIRITGVSWSCSSWDSKRTAFTATDPTTGKRVSGRVCHNVLLGDFIRVGLF